MIKQNHAICKNINISCLDNCMCSIARKTSKLNHNEKDLIVFEYIFPLA